MKHLHGWFWLSLLTLLPACSFHQTNLALQPLGPSPAAGYQASPEATLVVYSAWDMFGDPNSLNQHSSYVVAAADGTPVKPVQNHLDRFDEGPQPVTLPPGSYTVTARAAHFGTVKVPVVLKAHQTTTVYLDGYSHREIAAATQTNLVKLPDGQIAGWAADVAGK